MLTVHAVYYKPTNQIGYQSLASRTGAASKSAAGAAIRLPDQ